MRLETLVTIAAVAALVAVVSGPVFQVARQLGPIMTALNGDDGIEATCSLLALLLLVTSPLVAMAFRKRPDFFGGWGHLAPMLTLAIPRSAAIRSTVVFAAATDLTGWFALLWSTAVAAAALGEAWTFVALSVPFHFLLLCNWQLLLAGFDMASLRWVGESVRRLLPRIVSIAVIGLLAVAGLHFTPATRGRDRLHKLVDRWSDLSPAWTAARLGPVHPVLAGLSRREEDPRIPTLQLLRTAGAAVAFLWAGSAALAFASRRGLVALVPGTAREGPGRPGLGAATVRGLGLLDRPDRFKLSTAALACAMIAAAGSAQDMVPLWVLASLGPIMSAAVAVSLYGNSLREVLLLRVPCSAERYLSARATSAAVLTLACVLPPVALILGDYPARELLFPIGWGVLAVVLASWAGVTATAVLYPRPGDHSFGLRLGALMLLLAALLGPIVGASAHAEAGLALWTAGLPVLAMCRLWQVGLHRHRWFFDPDPPERPGRDVDTAVWLFLGGSLLMPLVAGGLLSIGWIDRDGALLMVFGLLPAGLGGAAWYLRRPEPGPPRGWMGGLSVGAGLLLLSVLYGHLLGRLGWDAPGQGGVTELLTSMARRPGALVMAAFLAGLVLPVAEELFFRGLLYPGLAESSGRTAAALISSLAFALLHPLAHAPYTLLFGLVMCRLRDRHGGLTAPVVAHVFGNAAIIAGGLLS